MCDCKSAINQEMITNDVTDFIMLTQQGVKLLRFRILMNHIFCNKVGENIHFFKLKQKRQFKNKNLKFEKNFSYLDHLCFKTSSLHHRLKPF